MTFQPCIIISGNNTEKHLAVKNIISPTKTYIYIYILNDANIEQRICVYRFISSLISYFSTEKPRQYIHETASGADDGPAGLLLEFPSVVQVCVDQTSRRDKGFAVPRQHAYATRHENDRSETLRGTYNVM